MYTNIHTAPIRKFPQFRHRARRGHLGWRAQDTTRGARGWTGAMSRGHSRRADGQPSAPFGRRGPVQCKGRALPPPRVAGS
eukprot:1899885-Pyramimonas_sp.AAC.1